MAGWDNNDKTMNETQNASPVEGFRISVLQQRLWKLAAAHPVLGRLRVDVDLRGDVQVARLQGHLADAIVRHEILRTRFVSVPGLAWPVQCIDDADAVQAQQAKVLQIEDLSALDAGEAQAWHDAVLARMAGLSPADQALAACLLRMGDGRHVLSLSASSLCLDQPALMALARHCVLGLDTSSSATQDDAEPLQYADFAEWHHEVMAAPEAATAAQRWRPVLDSARTHSRLGLEQGPMWGQQTGGLTDASAATPVRGAWLPSAPCEVATLDMNALAQAATRFGVEPESLLLTAWRWVLQRQTGESGAVACWSKGRPGVAEGAWGAFARFLPIAGEVAPATSALAFMQETHEALAEARAWQDFFVWPDDSTPEHAFVWGADDELIEDGAITANIRLQQPWSERFKLALHGRLKQGLAKDSEEIVLEIVHDRESFDGLAAHELGRQYLCVLSSLTSLAVEQKTPLAVLPLMDDGALASHLARCHGGAASHAAPAWLHEAFEREAQRRPEAVAVTLHDTSITYGELDARANRLAALLRVRGAQADAPVGVCAHRSFDMVLGLLAALKAGCAYLPLDPAYPADRLAYMVDDAAVAIVLAQRETEALLPACRVQVLRMDDATAVEDKGQVPDARISSGAWHASQLAYVIYTSGSTGRPKGVGISHRNAVSSNAAREAFYPGKAERYLLLSSFAFDSSVAGLFWTLGQGGTLCMVDEDQQKDPAALAAIIERQAITHVLGLPSLYLQILQEAEPAQLASLRVVIVAGEACGAELVRRHATQVSGAALYNEYGPTENSVWSTVYRCHPSQALLPLSTGAASGTMVPIGRPITGSLACVVDADLNLAPPGVAGELVVGGEGVARGYLARAALTADRFVPDPFGNSLGLASGARLYRTGDLARMRLDGQIEFLGRIDHQVKIRGHRIELGEVESALRAQAGVLEAVAMAREDEPGDQRLVAYVTPASGLAQPLDGQALRDALRQRLPDYMVPSVVAVLAEMPLTPNGKLDRRALPVPQAASASAEYTPPRHALEAVLAGIWEDVLKVARVGVHDNFFELGGHSLVATQVVSRARQACQVELPVRALFAAPTVAGLAMAIEAARRQSAASHSVLPPMLPRASEQEGAALPLSFSQERLWFLQQLEPRSAAYHIAGALKLTGPLNADAVAQAFQALVQRHEALRTTFHEEDGRAVQRIHASAHLPISVQDLRGLPPEGRDAAVTQASMAAAREPFDLGRGPLLRVALWRVDENMHRLLLVMHHIVSDGWSTQILLREFSEYYAVLTGQTRGSSVVTAASQVATASPSLQYADYALWQRQALQGDALQAQIAHWRSALGEEHPVLDLPTDRPRPAEPSGRGAIHRFALDAELSSQLASLARQQGVTLFMLTLAAFQALMHRLASQDDVRVGVPVANRHRLETEEVLGCFVNTMVMRARCAGSLSFEALLAQVREAALQAQAGQDLPFEMLVDALQPERDLSRTPLFQVMFDHERRLDAPWSKEPDGATGLGLEIEPIDTGTAKFDLTITVTEDGQPGQPLLVAIEYSTDLFDTATIERLGSRYEQVLTQVVADPARRLGELALLTPAEEAERHRWNESIDTATLADDVWALFEQQARREPAATAVRCGDDALSYGELMRQAQQVGRSLSSMGVGPDDVVAVHGERGVDWLVMMLGIFHIGAAYLPLDARLPSGRLAEMLALSRCAAVLAGPSASNALGMALESLTGRVPKRLAWIAARRGVPSGQAPALPRPPSGANAGAAKGELLAYVIYTSGSTGVPKGAMVTRRGLLNNLLQKHRQLGLKAGDVVAQTAGVGFDVSVWQFLSGLLCGAVIEIVPDDTVRDAGAMWACLRERKVAVFESVPSLIQALLSEPAAKSPQGALALRWLLPTGEALPPELARRWLERHPSIPMLNVYGPAECADDVAVHAIVSPPPLDCAHMPIGRPVPNLRLHVLDAHLMPVPTGAPGELCVAGVGVGRGYLNDAARTAAAFVPDPWGSPGERLYRTGDLARQRDDGVFEYLGRVDHQVKLRGQRLELGEVEARLAALPGVAQAVATVQDSRHLVAYVAPEALDTDVLKAALAQVLPDFMVPWAIVALPALPLNANGKLDRRALPPVTLSQCDEVLPDVERVSWTPAEQVLAAVWARVLNLPQVGLDQNFFGLGGDSIQSIQVVSGARQAGWQLAPKDMFLHQTVRAQARVARPAAPAQAEHAPMQGDVALAPIQHWFFEQGFANPHHWNQSVLLAPGTPLSLAPLQAALDQLAAHHDALRLRFERTSSGWRQHCVAQAVVPVKLIDVPSFEHADFEAACRACQAGLDIEQGPVFQATLLQAGGAQRLLLAAHHLAVDGWSWRVLIEDLTHLLNTAMQVAAALPARTASFQHWTALLGAPTWQAAARSEAAWWADAVSAWPEPWPMDKPSGLATEATIRTLPLALSADRTHALLTQAAPALRAKVDEVLLAALLQSLGEWSGAAEVGFELETHGRDPLKGLADAGSVAGADVPDLSRTVGWFTALYPLRLPTLRGQSLSAVLKAVKERLRAVPEGGQGYGILRHLQGEPLAVRPQVSFNYLGQFDASLTGGGLFSLAPEACPGQYDERATSHCAFDLNGYIAEGVLHLDWRYSSAQYDSATVQALAESFIGHLNAVIDQPLDQAAQALSPADFPDAGLDAQALAGLLDDME